MLQQLQNPLHCRTLDLDPMEQHANKIKLWGGKWLCEGQISLAIAQWITETKAKPGVAFGNVKTHKPGNPLRLITSCCGKAIERLSAFTEFHLTPLRKNCLHLSKTQPIYLLR